ncbi:MAG: RNA-guided pseudouridylation complex pseudouridine synthase subunit Cbf5 [Candidatus Saliniplasma sp.]
MGLEMDHIIEKNNTISRWGKYPHERSVEEALKRSLIIIDKPSGPTSHQVSSWIQDMFDMKAGHSGTLDPNVTGVLPMGLGYSVRVIDLLHNVPKEYIAAMHFHWDVDFERVNEILKEFQGDIYQTPPLKSGVKRERRIRKIFEIEVLDSSDRDYLFFVKCESGTYIRTLCKDIGKAIGTGGHMMDLRRTKSGGFSEEESYILQDVKDALISYRSGDGSMLKEMLLPYERALEVYPKIVVKDTAAGSLLNGADLAVPGILKMEDFKDAEIVSLVSTKGEGIAIGESVYRAEKIMDMDKGLVVKTTRVFHPVGEYPQKWK